MFISLQQNGDTIAHYIARLCNFTEPFEYMEQKTQIDFSILNNVSSYFNFFTKILLILTCTIKDGYDALHFAAENRHYEVVKWLKNKSGKPKNKACPLYHNSYKCIYLQL